MLTFVYSHVDKNLKLIFLIYKMYIFFWKLFIEFLLFHLIIITFECLLFLFFINFFIYYFIFFTFIKNQSIILCCTKKSQEQIHPTQKTQLPVHKPI